MTVIVEHGDDLTISIGRELRVVKRSELVFENPCYEIAVEYAQMCNLGEVPCNICGKREVCLPAFQIVGKREPYPVVVVCSSCYNQFCVPLSPKEVVDEG